MSLPFPPGGADAAAALPTLAAGQRARLSDRLYREVFDQIVAGELNVGDQLPSENTLSARYGVSRPVVREALQRLRADGLVAARQGLGTFVAMQPSPRLGAFAGAANVAAYLRCQEVRVAVEGDTARLAAERRGPQQMAAIEAAHQHFAQAALAGATQPADDLAFHRAIAAATGNDFYLHVLDTTHEALSGFMRLSLTLTRATGSARRAQQVVDEHQAVVDAIAHRDPERARVAMQHHLQQARERLVNREQER